MKIHKKKNWWGEDRGGVGGRELGGDQGGCERRIEFFVKIHKKKIGGGSGRGGGSGWGRVRMDVNEDLKFL